MPARIQKEEHWRCKLSEAGRELHRSNPERRGTAWNNKMTNDAVRVIWDGTKEPISYGSRFIERDDASQEPKP